MLVRISAVELAVAAAAAAGSVSRLPGVVLLVAVLLPGCPAPCTADPFADRVGTVSVPPGVRVGGVAFAAFVGELSGVGPMIIRDVSISRLDGSLGAVLWPAAPPYAELCSSRAGFC